MQTFRALFGDGGGSGDQGKTGPPESSEELDALLNVILDPSNESSERRAAAYSLRELFNTDTRDLARAYASAVVKRLGQFESTLTEEDNEEVAQTLLEILTAATEQSAQTLLRSSEVILALMGVAKSSPYVWVRVCAIQSLQALSVHSPKETSDLLLSIPSALEDLVGFLNDIEIDVRNEMLILLQKLTESNEQVRMFMTFCDGPASLLNIALREMSTITAADCLAVCFNILQGNPVGQKQFAETQGFLDSISELLVVEDNPTNSTATILRITECVKLIRVLCQGRAENKSNIVREQTIRYGQDERRATSLRDIQTKVGSTRNLMKNLFHVASDVSFMEDETRKEAMYALGDLICRNPRNAAMVERLAGFSHIVNVALNSPRWMDAKAAVYAWICAMDGANSEGEQRAISLLGHAVAPPPEAFDSDGVEPVDNAALWAARAVLQSTQAVRELRDEVYVDPSRILDCRRAMWRALRLWEMLLVSSSAKEIALKIDVEGKCLFDMLCQCASEFTQEKDEADTVKNLVSDTCCCIIRLLAVWVLNDRASASHLLSSASNIFFFGPLGWNEDMKRLGALLSACCLISTWDAKEKSVAFGLIENKTGISKFLSLLTSLRDPIAKGRSNPSENDWNDDQCTRIIFDNQFATFAERVTSQADALLVRGSSTGSKQAPTATVTVGVNGSSHVEGEKDTGYISPNQSELALKLQRLEQDYAQLLLILAHQEIERQSLLQTIQDLGGREALDAALHKSALLLSKSFEELDAKGKDIIYYELLPGILYLLRLLVKVFLRAQLNGLRFASVLDAYVGALRGWRRMHSDSVMQVTG